MLIIETDAMLCLPIQFYCLNTGCKRLKLFIAIKIGPKTRAHFYVKYLLDFSSVQNDRPIQARGSYFRMECENLTSIFNFQFSMDPIFGITR